MDSNKISLLNTPLINQTIRDYIDSDDLDSFISYKPTIDGFEKTIDQRSIKFNRKELVSSLLEQNTSNHDQVINNIKLLANQNTFTVTTGHQICLFTGPLYSIYKIISTIKLTKILNTEFPSKNFVPVFWMATEDHDKAEIDHIKLFGKKIQWDTQQTGAVGNFNLNDIKPILNELEELFKNDYKNIAPLINAYKNADSLSIAHRELINILFGEYGLVVIDANTHYFKKPFLPIIKEELLKQPSRQLILNQSNKLLEKGYKSQINPREINLFYLDKDSRKRIIHENGIYKIHNSTLSFTKEQLIYELDKFPEKFSPNVALRPLYQEYILPNIATVLGPGEMAYWLQLKTTFNFFQVDFPSLVLRDSALMLNRSVSKKIEQYKLTNEDLFRAPDTLIKEKIIASSEVSFEEEINELQKVFEIAKNKATRIDVSLEKTVIGELKKAQNSMNMIMSKTIKAEKRKNEVVVSQIQSIHNSIYPEGHFQERHLNFLNFYSNDFIKKLIEEFNPLEFQLKIFKV